MTTISRVFDVRKWEVVANLDGFPSVHGVLAVPEVNCIFGSATDAHRLAIVDMETLKTPAKASPIKYPDRMAYASGPKRIFVSDEHGNADAVIDATSDTLIATIKLDGGAGNTVYDPGTFRTLVAVHEKNELVSIDPATAKIISHHPVPGIEGPHGIVLDVDSRLAFVAGEENSELAVFDSDEQPRTRDLSGRQRSRCLGIRSGAQTRLCLRRIRKRDCLSPTG